MYMALAIIRTPDQLYNKHGDGLCLAVVNPGMGEDSYPQGGFRVIVGKIALNAAELEGLTHYQVTGGAEGIETGLPPV